MNFYPHHIGDYMTATVHLSWLEDCAYRRLLDVYYSREQSLPDVTQACRLVRATSKDERKAVETVLNEFFTLSAGSWTHPRCEAEIEKAKAAAERAKQNGARGGRPPKQEPTTNPEITQLVSVANPEKSNSQAPNPNPITNTKETPKAPKGAVVGFDEFWNAYPRKDAKPNALKAFAKVTEPLQTLLAAIERQKRSEGWIKDGGKFIPMPATWLNGERWNDGVVSVQQDDESRDRIERMGVDKGIGPWDCLTEQWPAYKQRVLKAPHAKGFDLASLSKLAADRQGATA